MTEVAVVGGGIIGCSIARDLALAGAEVTVVEQRQASCEASAASGGNLVPLVALDQAGPSSVHRLCLEGLRACPSPLAELEEAGCRVSQWASGNLRRALNKEEALALHDRLEQCRRAGTDLQLDWLGG
jgi:glycine oxidase